QVSNFDGKGVPSRDNDNQPTSFTLQISLQPNPISANLNNQGQPSGIFAYTTGAGKAGNILLNTNNLKLESGGSISAFTNGIGTGGTININATNSVNLGVGVQNFAPVVSVETNGAGKAGDIIINTPNFTLSETARITATATKNATNTEQGGSITLNANKMNLAGIVGIFAETQGAAPAGTLKLNPYNNQNTLDLTLFPGSIISASTSGSGNGGDFQITAPDTINITGKGKLAVETQGTGNAGNILISTQNLNVKEAEISANTTSAGKAGSININSANINIEQDAKISATTSGGSGGSININNAQTLNLNNGSQLLTTTLGNNAAGDINIQVKDSINLNGENTGFFANTAPNSTGNGGNIKIDPLTMNIENGAAIAVNSEGTGIGGNIFLQAGNLVLNNGNINAETVNSNGGGITLEIGNYLLLANNSKITSTAGTLQSGGNGGNVQINAPFIIGFATNPNHQIIANAFSGKGGNILINTNGIFGTEYINIQASSQSGPQGIVEINTPGIDPANGLTQLPNIPIDLSALINNSCQVAAKNSFTVTGKGGLTPTPDETLSVNSILPDWGNSANIPQKSSLISVNTLQKEKTNQQEEIREAQGFIKDEKGNIILTS
ncbi:MAG TPA: S-layer family protein, partial [Allocoleopsis sp.]